MEIFLILFLIDGTDLRMRYLDHLKVDSSYARTIETDEGVMLSSSSARRFFASVSHVRVWLLRKVLQTLFVWHMNIEKLEIIKIGLDTVVDGPGQLQLPEKKERSLPTRS